MVNNSANCRYNESPGTYTANSANTWLVVRPEFFSFISLVPYHIFNQSFDGIIQKLICSGADLGPGLNGYKTPPGVKRLIYSLPWLCVISSGRINFHDLLIVGGGNDDNEGVSQPVVSHRGFQVVADRKGRAKGSTALFWYIFPTVYPLSSLSLNWSLTQH